MTVEEVFDAYIKLIPEERTKFLTKVNSWLIQQVKDRQKLEQEKSLNKDVPNS
jgi:hypothetical protein